MYALTDTTTAKQKQAVSSSQKNRAMQLRVLPSAPVLQKQQNAVVQLVKDPANKQKAIDQHKIDQDRVYKIVDDALIADVPPAKDASRAKLLKNTAELIQDGFVPLTVMSRTHNGPGFRTASEIAYFDSAVKYPNKGGDYNSADDDTHVFMGSPDANAHSDQRGEVRFFDPSAVSDENIKTVLIHESQHTADLHHKFQSFTQAPVDDKTTERAINGYQSELRAYWQGGFYKDRKHLGNSYDILGFSFMPATNTRKVPSGSIFTPDYATSFKNQRQENIFWHMIDSSSYVYVLDAYQKSAAYRDMVHNFTMPVGGNILNSLRIEKLQAQVRTLRMHKSAYSDFIKIAGNMPSEERMPKMIKCMNDVDNALLRMEELRKNLDREDIEFLSDRGQSAPFWSYTQAMVDKEVTEELYEFVTYRRNSFRHKELMASLGIKTDESFLNSLIESL